MSDWRIRVADEADADAIAAAHLASIRELGSLAYDCEVIEAWGQPRDGSRYVAAMRQGWRFFVAESEEGEVLGFSSGGISDRADLAVYVRGTAARRGIGSALLTAALDALRELGAAEIEIHASLNSAGFYEAHGFETHGEHEHRLSCGETMACIRMSKRLA